MSMSMSMSSACLPACFLFLFWAELILIDDDIISVLACMHTHTHTHTQINKCVVQFTVLITIHGVILRGLVSGRRESHVSPSTPLNLPGVSQSLPILFARVASLALLPSLHAIARSQTKCCCCCCCCSGKAVHGTSSFSQELFWHFAEQSFFSNFLDRAFFGHLVTLVDLSSSCCSLGQAGKQTSSSQYPSIVHALSALQSIGVHV